MSHKRNMYIERLENNVTHSSDVFSHLTGSMKMKIAMSTIAILTLSTNVFASDVVVLECGEFNFNPGINIKVVSTSLGTTPPYLAEGSSCAVAIANLLGRGFKIQDSSVSTAQFFAADNTVHNYTLIK